MWANEAEAAVLSGYSLDAFRDGVRDLEKAGFPQVSRWNGKRFIPAILDFWAAQVDKAPVTKPESDLDGPQVENFNGQKRRA